MTIFQKQNTWLKEYATFRLQFCENSQDHIMDSADVGAVSKCGP